MGRLSESAGEIDGASVSLITEVALEKLLGLPKAEVAALVTRHRFARRATTRAGWMSAFWHLVAEELGRHDRIANAYAPRQYGDFTLVILMNRADGREEESDPFPVTLWPTMNTPQSPSPERWVFDRDHSPVAAAEAVAVKLRDLGVPISTGARSSASP